MNEHIDCKTALGLMSAAVDGELRAEKLQVFQHHISDCASCRAELDAERSTKALLKSKLRRVAAPQSLVDAIRKQTAAHSASVSVSKVAVQAAQEFPFAQTRLTAAKPNWKTSLVNFLYIDPQVQSRSNAFFAVGLATCILSMLVFAGFVHERSRGHIDGTDLQIEHNPASNIFEMTTTVYEAGLGTAPAELQTSNPQVVSNYLTKALGFRADVPSVQNFNVAGSRLAAFGCANGGEIIYRNKSSKSQVSVFVMNENDLSSKQSIPAVVMDYISENPHNFYRKTCPQGRTVTIWKWGTAIYTATTADVALDLAQITRNPNW